MFNKENREKLLSKGLIISEEEDNLMWITKPKGIEGNFLPEKEPSPNEIILEANDVPTDCPIIQISKNENKISAFLWDWAPGPGPGDFDIDFDTEDDAVSFLINYYFGENEYFEARKNYLVQSRDSFNVHDLKNIFSKLLQQIEDHFNESEITFTERGTFHKIPIEKWRKTKFGEDKISIETESGFLNFEVWQLRKKIAEKTEFNQEDLTYIADMINGLSFLINN
jgi:hypothetical protein